MEESGGGIKLHAFMKFFMGVLVEFGHRSDTCFYLRSANSGGGGGGIKIVCIHEYFQGGSRNTACDLIWFDQPWKFTATPVVRALAFHL